MDNPFYIDLGMATEPGKCEHFSIRGYVADMRAKDKVKCLPFPSNSDYELPPIHAPQFKWWHCPSCLHGIGASSSSRGPNVCNQSLTLTDNQDVSEKVRDKRSRDCEKTPTNLCPVEENLLAKNNQVEKIAELSQQAANGNEMVKRTNNNEISCATCDSENLCTLFDGNRDSSDVDNLNHLCGNTNFRPTESDLYPNGEMLANKAEMTRGELLGVTAPAPPSPANEEVIIGCKKHVQETEIRPIQKVTDNASPVDRVSLGGVPQNQSCETINDISRPKFRRLSDLLKGERDNRRNSRRKEGSNLNNSSNSEVMVSDSVVSLQGNFVSAQLKRKIPQDPSDLNKKSRSNIELNGGQQSKPEGERIILPSKSVETQRKQVSDSFMRDKRGVGVEELVHMQHSEKISTLGNKRIGMTPDSDNVAVSRPPVVRTVGECSARRNVVPNMRESGRNAASNAVELDLYLNSFLTAERNKRNSGVKKDQSGKDVWRNDGHYVGESSYSVRSPPNINGSMAHRTANSNQCSFPLPSDGIPLEQRSDLSDQGNRASEDIPMEIVELMAKHQYERGFAESRNHPLQRNGTSNIRVPPSAENSSLTRPEPVSSSHQRTNLFCLRPQAQLPTGSAFQPFSQNQLRPPSGVHFHNTQGHVNAVTLGTHWNNHSYPQRPPPSNANVLKPAESVRNMNPSVTGSALLSGNHNSQLCSAREYHVGHHSRAEEPDLNLSLNASSLQPQQSYRMSPLHPDEAIPAMQLLGLMNAGKHPSGNLGMDRNKAFYPCINNPNFSLGGYSVLSYPGANSAGHQTIRSPSHQPSTQARNGFSQRPDDLAHSGFGANQFSFLLPASRSVWRPTNIGGQSVPRTTEQERGTSSNLHAGNFDVRVWKSQVGGPSFASEGLRATHHSTPGIVRPSIVLNGRENICAMNRNPADLSPPGEGNDYMICGEALRPFNYSSRRETISLNVDGVKKQRVSKTKTIKSTVQRLPS